MTTRFRRVALLSLLCVTAFATPASSGDYWVLWDKAHLIRDGKETGEVVFKPVSVHVKPGECYFALGAANDAQVAKLARQLKEPEYEGKYDVHFFECWPDTIDPRGPKK